MLPGVRMSRAASTYFGSGLASAAASRSVFSSSRVSLDGRGLQLLLERGGKLSGGVCGRDRAGDDLRLGRDPAALPVAVDPGLRRALERVAVLGPQLDLLDVAVAGPVRRARLVGGHAGGRAQQLGRGGGGREGALVAAGERGERREERDRRETRRGRDPLAAPLGAAVGAGQQRRDLVRRSARWARAARADPSSVGLQGLAQGVAAAAEQRADGGGAAAERAGDRVVGQVVDVAQRQRGALARGEGGEQRERCAVSRAVRRPAGRGAPGARPCGGGGACGSRRSPCARRPCAARRRASPGRGASGRAGRRRSPPPARRPRRPPRRRARRAPSSGRRRARGRRDRFASRPARPRCAGASPRSRGGSRIGHVP